MPNYNQATLIGHLGRDPEVRYTQNETAVTNASLATTTRWKDRNDEWQKDTQWHRLVIWGDSGERFSDRCGKGTPVFVTGEIRYREWEDSEGDIRNATEIVVREWRALDKVERDDDDDTDNRRSQRKKKDRGQTKGGRKSKNGKSRRNRRRDDDDDDSEPGQDKIPF